MCTLIAAVGQFKDAPLVIAANRDEHLDRPASPPLLWTAGPQPFIAGRDELGGGTWLGFNRSGVFVGVTNRFGVDRDPGRASRGALVVEALGAGSARELHARLQALAPTRYNAFHLLYADRAGAFVTWCDGQVLHQQELPPGVHVVTERSLGGDDRSRTETVLARWRELPAGKAPTPAELFDVLCRAYVHVPAFNFGTRSSCTLKLSPGSEEMWWAEGSPCKSEPRRLDALMDALKQAPK